MRAPSLYERARLDVFEQAREPGSFKAGAGHIVNVPDTARVAARQLSERAEQPPRTAQASPSGSLQARGGLRIETPDNGDSGVTGQSEQGKGAQQTQAARPVCIEALR